MAGETATLMGAGVAEMKAMVFALGSASEVAVICSPEITVAARVNEFETSGHGI
jgi:hypothetical protein